MKIYKPTIFLVWNAEEKHEIKLRLVNFWYTLWLCFSGANKPVRFAVLGSNFGKINSEET